jgi:lipid-A-disaccharide synthase
MELIAASDAAIVTSGTATLETAILGKPMVIIYKLPLLEYLIAKPLLLLKNIGLVNIVAGKQVVPELIQFQARPKLIAKAMIDILTDKQKYGEIKSNLAAVKNSLYPAGAAQRAAASILKLL